MRHLLEDLEGWVGQEHGAGRSPGEPSALVAGATREAPLAGRHGGPLLPVREGWLLRRAEGYRPWDLLPAAYQRRTLFWAVAPLVVLDLLSLALGGPTVFTCLGFLVMLRGCRAIADTLIRRAIDGRPCRTSVAGRARGEAVRLRGRVRPGTSFASAGGRWPSVLAAYAGTADHPARRAGGPASGSSKVKRMGRLWRRRRRTRPWAEVRGMDFLLDLPGGESVVVAARDAYLLAPPEARVDIASCRREEVVTAPLGRIFRRDDDGTVIESVLAELVVGPGDEVEVFGVLDWEVSPAATDGPGRAGGLAPVLKSSPRVPLVVRPRSLSRT